MCRDELFGCLFLIVGESVFGIYQIKQLPLNLQRKCECCDQELWFGKLMNHTKCHTVECLVTLPADELLSAYVAIPHGRRQNWIPVFMV